MVDTATQHGEVVLFYATQSLVLQVADWVRKQPNLSLRLVSTQTTVDFQAELRSASIVIVDATDDAARAVSALDQAGRQLGRTRVAVYTEADHRGLSRWVDMHGAAMVVGPMSHGEWAVFFSPKRRVRKARPVATRTEKFGPRVMPLPTTYLMDRMQAANERQYEMATEEAMAW